MLTRLWDTAEQRLFGHRSHLLYIPSMNAQTHAFVWCDRFWKEQLQWHQQQQKKSEWSARRHTNKDIRQWVRILETTKRNAQNARLFINSCECNVLYTY